MEEIYANADCDKPDDRGPSINQTYPRSPRSVYGAVILFLGLLSVLLLAGVIGLSVQCHHSARKLQACDVSLAETAEELRCLSPCPLMEKKMCPSNWTRFGCSCYFFSAKTRLQKSWALSRKDCKDRGADLVVINSLEEQTFVSNALEKAAWIGLSDVDKEGTWKWTDGSPLTLSFWINNQPDNGGGDPTWGQEDCVHVYTTAVRKPEENWNDLACHRSHPYVCEK